MACNALSSLNFVVPKHSLFSDPLHSAARSRLALPPPPRVASIPLVAEDTLNQLLGRSVPSWPQAVASLRFPPVETGSLVILKATLAGPLPCP